MTRDDIKLIVLDCLGAIAPETNLEQIRPTDTLRRQLDIDSMDYLNFVIALHKRLDLEIPERDYPKLATLDGCVDYLSLALQRGES